MKIVFLSNYFNHHQKPFSDEMFKRLGDDYCFIETSRVPQARLNLGYGYDELPRYVKKSYTGADDMEQCQRLIDEADVVIVGSAPEAMVRNRIRKGKLLFRYSERPLKKGLELWKYPYRYIKWHIRNPMTKPIYMLCASAYTAGDYAMFGLFRGRCYKWGYFPEVKRYDDIESMIDSKRKYTLLWVGRMIDWKHPEAAIHTAKRLKDDGYSFTLDFIGIGPMEDELRRMISENGLDDCVNMLGSMKPEQVREHMERSEIFLFTSDRNEGWGAVLNESMNSGCAVVASHAIGSVPFMVDDGVNGMVYTSGDNDMLYEKVKWLIDHPGERKSMGRAAYETMVNEWSPEVAAERLIEVIGQVNIHKNIKLFDEGVCSNI